jgi:endonuclease/exonuclease/phosphatase (EEP) superfamily protein YafD
MQIPGWAQLRRPGAPFTAVAVHLLPPYPYPSGEWRSEISGLHTLLAALTAAEVVVAGDFNATVDHAQFRGLRAGSAHTFDLPGPDHRALLAQLYR